MKISRAQIMRSPRSGGAVQRYHTWRCIVKQTNADHSWNVMRLYWQLFGPLPPEVSTYIIWHDCGELGSGDLPFPVKARNNQLKRIVDTIEEESVIRMGGPSLSLAAPLKVRVKACDLIEMHEYGLTELALGNRFAQPIADDTKASCLALPLTEADRAAVSMYLQQLEDGGVP